MSKRSPGATGRTTSLMFHEERSAIALQWSLDMSRYVGDLLPFALSELRHNDAKRREVGLVFTCVSDTLLFLYHDGISGR